MGFIEWSSSLDIGIELIDEQHRDLVDRINRLAAAKEEGVARLEVGAIVEGLEAYAKTHFSLEEGYFERFDYPDAAVHVKEHESFAGKVAVFRREFAEERAELSDEILAFLKSWLTTHIAFTDRKYKPWFVQKGVH